MTDHLEAPRSERLVKPGDVPGRQNLGRGLKTSKYPCQENLQSENLIMALVSLIPQWADWAFMPAFILTGCILHQRIGFIEIHLIWLLQGFSPDFRGGLTHILRAILFLAPWLTRDSCYVCFPAGCNSTSIALICAPLIFPGIGKPMG